MSRTFVLNITPSRYISKVKNFETLELPFLLICHFILLFFKKLSLEVTWSNQQTQPRPYIFTLKNHGKKFNAGIGE